MEFEKYKELVEKYYQNDCRELNFQNRVIIPFLESFLSKHEVEVVDSSTLYKNWENYKDDNHNGICRDKFANNYTPDLLIIKNWKLFDENKIAPSIIIEVKRPTARDRTHATNEVNEFLKKAEHVILTDSITWEFYDRNTEKNSPKIIYLDADEKSVCKRDSNVKRNIKWDKLDKFENIKNKISTLIQQLEIDD